MSREFKYKIGTRVNHKEYGSGTIIDRCSISYFCPYLVEFDNAKSHFHDGNTLPIEVSERKKLGKKNHCFWTFEEHMTPINTETKRNSWKVIIEGNGDVTTAKYIEGKNPVKTETVKRYYTDEFSVFKAIEALNNKLFGEEKNEPKFKPGDLVEVVENYERCPSGLRGHIVKDCGKGCWLVDFRVKYKFTHNASLEDEPLPKSTGYYLKEKCIRKVD